MLQTLTKKEEKSYIKQNLYHLCKQEFDEDFNEDENCCNVRDHCHYTCRYCDAARSIYNLRYKSSKEILLLFHNGFNKD